MTPSTTARLGTILLTVLPTLGGPTLGVPATRVAGGTTITPSVRSDQEPDDGGEPGDDVMASAQCHSGGPGVILAFCNGDNDDIDTDGGQSMGDEAVDTETGLVGNDQESHQEPQEPNDGDPNIGDPIVGVWPPPTDCAARGPAVYLTGCDLGGANLSGVNLHGAHLYGANLAGANLSGADLGGAYISTLYGPDEVPACTNLNGANPSQAYLGCANLRGAVLPNANLSGARLGQADLRGADLTGADLSNADVRGANLFGVDLTGAMVAGSIGSGRSVRTAAKLPPMTLIRALGTCSRGRPFTSR